MFKESPSKSKSAGRTPSKKSYPSTSISDKCGNCEACERRQLRASQLRSSHHGTPHKTQDNQLDVCVSPGAMDLKTPDGNIVLVNFIRLNSNKCNFYWSKFE